MYECAYVVILSILCKVKQSTQLIICTWSILEKIIFSEHVLPTSNYFLHFVFHNVTAIPKYVITTSVFTSLLLMMMSSWSSNIWINSAGEPLNFDLSKSAIICGTVCFIFSHPWTSEILRDQVISRYQIVYMNIWTSSRRKHLLIMFFMSLC